MAPCVFATQVAIRKRARAIQLHRRCTREQRGFTLIELIACIVIMGVLAAFAAPNFVGNQAFVERGYADEVAGSLRYAQRVAIASDCPVQVTLIAAGYSAWQRPIHANCNNPGAWAQAVIRTDGAPLAGTSPAGVNVNASTVQFGADGTVAGGSVNIGIGARVLAVDGATGRVSLQ